jgi:hypothetical protein
MGKRDLGVLAQNDVRGVVGPAILLISAIFNFASDRDGIALEVGLGEKRVETLAPGNDAVGLGVFLAVVILRGDEVEGCDNTIILKGACLCDGSDAANEGN